MILGAGARTPDPQTLATVIRDGNYDFLTNSQRWHNTPGGFAMPNSMYLTSKPAFFGNNPWPWTDPATGAITSFPLKQGMTPAPLTDEPSRSSDGQQLFYTCRHCGRPSISSGGGFFIGAHHDGRKLPGLSCLHSEIRGGQVERPARSGRPDNGGRDAGDVRRVPRKKGARMQGRLHDGAAERDEIYRNEYWNAVNGDRLRAGEDLCVFDFAVNSGPARALEVWRRCGASRLSPSHRP